MFSAPEVLEATAAAVEYVNNELDGIGGRPLELETCTTSNTPESVLECASQLLAKDPLLIIPGPDAAAAAAAPVYEQAGVALIGGSAFTPQEFTLPNRLLFQGWSASLFPGMVHFATTELDSEHIVAIGLDEPTYQLILDAFMNPLMERRGLPPLDFVGTPANTPDFTAPMAAALAEDPEAILAFGLPCEPVVQAYADLGTDVPLVMPDNCTDPGILESEGAIGDGVYYVTQVDAPSFAAGEPAVDLYSRVVEEYGDGDITESSLGLAAFSSVLIVHDALDGLDVDTLGPTDVLSTFRSISDGDNPMIGTFNCAEPPLPAFPALCNVSARLAQVTDGVLEPVTDWATVDELWNE